MFNIHDTVMYGNSNVCRIEDIRKEKFTGTEQLYYVLRPVNDDKATIYRLVDSDKVQMRKLLSREEICDLIQIMPDIEAEWIHNDQLRKEKFNAVLKEGDHRELVKLIKTIYYERKEKINAGKKLHMADEKILRDAEKKLHGEFAYVLQIKPEEVVPFIVGELSR